MYDLSCQGIQFLLKLIQILPCNLKILFVIVKETSIISGSALNLAARISLLVLFKNLLGISGRVLSNLMIIIFVIVSLSNHAAFVKESDNGPIFYRNMSCID